MLTPSPTDGPAPLPEGEEQAPPGTRAMAAVRWALVGLVALTAVAAWASHFSSARSATAQAQLPVQAPKFICPMHPAVVTEHKASCPICGMDLVPSAAPGARKRGSGEGVPGLAPVELSDERVKLMGMKTATASWGALGAPVRAVGFVTPTENGLISVSTRFAGWVENLPVAETGKLVARGEPLMTIYSPDLLNAQVVVLNSLRTGPKGPGAGVPQLVTELEREPRQRLELLGVSPEEIDSIIAAGVPRRTVPVRAPSRGYVVRKSVVKGNFVPAGAELFQLADLSRVWVLIDVYEGDQARVQLGQKATFEVASAPGQRYVGKVQFLNPVLSAGSRTLQARVEFENPKLELRPGMYGQLSLESAGIEGVVIPTEALVDTGDHRYVFVDEGKGRYEPRLVKAGATSDGKVAILEGLRAGEQVVTRANFLLDSESRLRATVEGDGR